MPGCTGWTGVSGVRTPIISARLDEASAARGGQGMWPYTAGPDGASAARGDQGMWPYTAGLEVASAPCGDQGILPYVVPRWSG